MCSSSEEVGSSRIDEPGRLVGHGEGARDLDHLAAADREALHEIAGRDAVAGKDLVELVEDQPAGALAPAEAAKARWEMRAFSATVRLGQSESSWNTQRMPSALASAAP